MLQSEVHWICDETGEELGPHQIKTHVNYGGQLVPIDREETTVIKSMAPRGKYKPTGCGRCWSKATHIRV